MIVILTEEVVRRGDGSYVVREIQQAIELEFDKIVLILVGGVNLDNRIKSLVERFQMIAVEKITGLSQNAKFLEYTRQLRDYIAAGGRKAQPGPATRDHEAEAVG